MALIEYIYYTLLYGYIVFGTVYIISRIYISIKTPRVEPLIQIINIDMIDSSESYPSNELGIIFREIGINNLE